MPTRVDGAAGSRKRKTPKEAGVPSSKRRAVADNQAEDDAMAEILKLEEQISESRKYYNNIATLISMLNADKPGQDPNLLVAVSLCRVFSRLIAGGNLSDSKRAAENEKIIVTWLKERCHEYQKALVSILRNADTSSQVCFLKFLSVASMLTAVQATALTLCMRLINERVTHIPSADSEVWSSGLFKGVFEAVVEARDGQVLQSEFIEKFVQPYEDVRYYTFMQVS